MLQVIGQIAVLAVFALFWFGVVMPAAKKAFDKIPNPRNRR